MLVWVILFLAVLTNGEEKPKEETRLGLLAPIIGKDPVPGFSGGLIQIPSKPVDVDPGPGPGYGQPPPPPIAKPKCQCVPAHQCPNYKSPQGYPEPKPSTGKPYVPEPGPSYGEYQPEPGYPDSAPPNGGYPPVNQHPPQVPDPSYPAHPHQPQVPDPGYPEENPGPGYPGDIPNNPEPNNPYIPPEVSNPVYPDVEHKPSYPNNEGSGYPGAGHTNPNKDGAGVIDIRIVNRAPGHGNVLCQSGHVFCCDEKTPEDNYKPPGGHHGGDHFPGGGYTGCGQRSIINVPGWKAEHGQAKFGSYPWMVVMLGKDNHYMGAGALINSNYVLTVAHKVKDWRPGTYMKVRLGEWNAEDDDEPYKNIEIDVDGVIIHPEFNPENLYNDVAIIRLAQPIDINAFPHIRSVCLPQGHAQDYFGHRCWVAGFGKDAFGNGKHSYIMKEVDLPIVQSGKCENQLRGTRLGKYFELNRSSFLCAGGEDGKDACTGDGGSPLVCEVNGKFNVVGLVAWGIGCADYGIPGVYVNVPHFLPWIEKIVSGYNYDVRSKSKSKTE